MSTNDKRTEQRRRQLKAGLIAFNNRHSAVPCRVREISETGARLEVDPALVPDTFELLVEMDGLEAACEVRWRRTNVIGVRFREKPRQGAPRRLQVLTPTRPEPPATLRKKPPVK